MAGVAYDFNLNVRVKLEYSARFKGIHDAHSVVAQVAYGF